MNLDIQMFSDELPEENTNIEIRTPEINYTSVYTGEDVTKVIVEVQIPAKDGDIFGYVTLSAIEGWTLSENNTKLTKEYTTNQTETITVTMVGFNGVIFDNATQMVSVEVYEITTSLYVRTNVEYTRETTEDYDSLIYATVIVSIKDSMIGSYLLSDANNGWTLSEDKLSMTKDLDTNGGYTEVCYVYPSGEADSESTRTSENIAFKVDKIGLIVSKPMVLYSTILSGDDVIGVNVSILDDYSFMEESGYAKLGEVEGWTLSEGNTKLTKTYYENTTETIEIPVVEAYGYSFDYFNQTQEIVVDQITYKKVVKGRCETTMCLYDVYTKTEIDNQNLKTDKKFAEINEKISNSSVGGGCVTLTGAIVLQGSGNGTTELNYPTGFTIDNSVLISLGIKVIENKNYNYAGDYVDSTDILENCYRRRLNLTSNKIKLTVYNPNTTEQTINYKIVLMKTE